jgi:hypothetical protein
MSRRSEIRKVAIMPHVGHGRPTLVDSLWQSGAFRANQTWRPRGQGGPGLGAGGPDDGAARAPLSLVDLMGRSIRTNASGTSCVTCIDVWVDVITS